MKLPARSTITRQQRKKNRVLLGQHSLLSAIVRDDSLVWLGLLAFVCTRGRAVRLARAVSTVPAMILLVAGCPLLRTE